MPTVIPHLLLWPHYEIIGFIFLPSIYSVSPLTDFLGNWVHTDVFRSNACQNHIFFFCFLGMFFFFFITIFRGRRELDFIGRHDLCLQERPSEL